MIATSSPSKRSAGRRSSQGFTLVEVIMALGIVSFGFVTTLGLLPVGLNVSQRAIDTTVVAQIAQHMTTQALQTDFSQLSGLGTGLSYFDERGKSTDLSTAIYAAQFEVKTKTALPSISTETSRLATVTIHVIPTRGVKSGALDPISDPNARKFTVLISDNGI